MTTVGNLSDINETFIIEPIFVSGDTVSACTSVYSNMILSCSGDTTISMGDGIITLDGNLYTNDNISATTLNASTFFSGGTNVIDIINNVDARLTGGTYNSSTRTLSLYDKKGITINITGVTGNYTTGTTLVGSTIYFNRNDAMSAYTVNLSSLTAATIYTANGTISSNRVVNIGSVDLSFSSSTYPNTLVLKNGNIGKGVSTPTNPFHLSAATDPIRIQGIQTSTDNLFLTIDNNGVIHNKTITIPSDTNAWSITGNSATTITTNFIGTVDENGLVFKTNNIISGYIDIINKNTSLGQYSLYSNFNGSGNTSIGYQTLYATGATQNIYCGGGFTDYDGNTAIRAVRVESDGSIDGGFVIGSGFDGTVYTIAIQDDGKILIGGDFTDYDGNTAIRIVRLNTDGSIDGGFASGGGFNATVYTIAIQDDGKILVGGNFGGYDGNTAIRAVRLNTDGSIDNSFECLATGVKGIYVKTIAIQDDGKMLLGGDFTDYDGNTVNNIVRVESDGSIDGGFVIGSGFDGTVNIILLPTNAFASGCVAVGHQAGYGQTDSNKLYIANNSGSTLIYGDFNTPYVQVNGELSVSSTTASFIPPVMTEGERLALPLKLGSIVYQTDGDEGLYLYKTIGWVLIG